MGEWILMACTRLIPEVSAARVEMKGSADLVRRRLLPGAKDTNAGSAADAGAARHVQQ